MQIKTDLGGKRIITFGYLEQATHTVGVDTPVRALMSGHMTVADIEEMEQKGRDAAESFRRNFFWG